MKKIFVLFLLCFTVLSNNAFADDPWGQRVNTNAILNVIKTSNIKQYMNRDKFLDYIEKHWAPTFQDLLDACIVSVSQDTRKNCETFFFDVVKEHNRLVDENEGKSNVVKTYECGNIRLSSAADAKTPAELACVSSVSAYKTCQGNHNMIGSAEVCNPKTRKCVYACLLNKMDFYNNKYKTICCNVSASADEVNCTMGNKEESYIDVTGPSTAELSSQGC